MIALFGSIKVTLLVTEWIVWFAKFTSLVFANQWKLVKYCLSIKKENSVLVFSCQLLKINFKAMLWDPMWNQSSLSLLRVIAERFDFRWRELFAEVLTSLWLVFTAKYRKVRKRIQKPVNRDLNASLKTIKYALLQHVKHEYTSERGVYRSFMK